MSHQRVGQSCLWPAVACVALVGMAFCSRVEEAKGGWVLLSLAEWASWSLAAIASSSRPDAASTSACWWPRAGVRRLVSGQVCQGGACIGRGENGSHGGNKLAQSESRGTRLQLRQPPLLPAPQRQSRAAPWPQPYRTIGQTCCRLRARVCCWLCRLAAAGPGPRADRPRRRRAVGSARQSSRHSAAPTGKPHLAAGAGHPPGWGFEEACQGLPACLSVERELAPPFQAAATHRGARPVSVWRCASRRARLGGQCQGERRRVGSCAWRVDLPV